MVIAIDGPAGCGKSTVARFLAEKLGFFYLNSGKFYRAVTAKCLSEGISSNEPQRVIDIAHKGKLTLNKGNVEFFSKNMEGLLQNSLIDSKVSQFSAIPSLRKIINDEIILISKTVNLIVEGRDMTTEVFPNAEVKVFLDANANVRAKRRFEERPEGFTYEAILEQIEQRDKLDREKAVGGLKQAADAFYIDTSYLTIPEVCDKVISIIKQKIKL